MSEPSDSLYFSKPDKKSDTFVRTSWWSPYGLVSKTLVRIFYPRIRVALWNSRVTHFPSAITKFMNLMSMPPSHPWLLLQFWSLTVICLLLAIQYSLAIGYRRYAYSTHCPAQKEVMIFWYYPFGKSIIIIKKRGNYKLKKLINFVASPARVKGRPGRPSLAAPRLRA